VDLRYSIRTLARTPGFTVIAVLTLVCRSTPRWVCLLRKSRPGKQQTDLFEQTAWYRYVAKDLDLCAPGMQPLEVHATCASDRLFPLLGVRAALGRTVTASEDPQAAILSFKLWRSRFGGNPAVFGRTLRLNEREFTIVGIMPADFARLR
jgi:hypothetical protein